MSNPYESCETTLTDGQHFPATLYTSMQLGIITNETTHLPVPTNFFPVRVIFGWIILTTYNT